MKTTTKRPAKSPPKVRARRTKAQKDAAAFLDLHAIVHFLLTEQRCPVIFEGRLAYVGCRGVSKEAFKLAIDRRVEKNLLAYLDRTIGPAPKALGLAP